MTNKPLLSICIATYNRCQFIGETLDSIIGQLTNEIELIVVDGASTDNTESVLMEYCNSTPQIRYFRLQEKGGVDQDYNKAVELAIGEMCWLFTDDDLLKPDAITKILHAIRQDYDLIVVNAEIRDKYVSQIIQSKKLSIPVNKIYSSSNFEQFFTDTADLLTFIGSVIIRKSIWEQRKREIYFGTEFIHVGVIFQHSFEKTILVIAEPYIVIRYGNAQWEPRRFNIWMFKWPKLIWSFQHFSNKAKNKITPLEPWRSFRTLFICRSDGELYYDIYQKYLSCVEANVFWKVCALFISIFPRDIISFIRKLYKYFKRLA